MPTVHHPKTSGSPSGIATLVTILIIAAIALSLALSVSLVSVSSLLTDLGERQSDVSLAAAEGCVEDTLVRLVRDSSYAGGSLGIGHAVCTVGVTGAGGSRTIQVTSTVATFTRKLRVDVSLQGGRVSVTDWQEQAE